MTKSIIKFFLYNRLFTAILLIAVVAGGLVTAPFAWEMDALPRDPVPVDAIPDLGENQQIIFTEWSGRSPQDIEDQITYPLTTALLGVPGVRTVRSSSMFGISSIYVIFKEDVEFYWSRSRILEKLNALPDNLLPDGVKPALGPDATALGQIYWYTLEGRDPKTGKPTSGWDPQDLRSIQDFYVRYGLASADGVSEIASIGGYVKEYQVDVDPLKMRTYGVNLAQVMRAVQNSNLDVGARTIEVNNVEYLVRGLGYIKEISDIENAVVAVSNNVPLRIKDIARVALGPAPRRGILDKSGAEATGGVVVARYGSNPLEVINNVKQKIEEISPGLPSVQLPDGTTSKVTIVPFYDRTGLIKETLGTLEEALVLEVLITILVVILMIRNLRASFAISATLPLAVLAVFVMMKYFSVDANIVALSGIAIAIGTMVDVGILMVENITRHLKEGTESSDPRSRLEIIYKASIEIAPAMLTAVSTTVVSFIPVFALEAAEGKLFHPLAYTKTFALVATAILAITTLPTVVYWLTGVWKPGKSRVAKTNLLRLVPSGLLLIGGVVVVLIGFPWAGVVILVFGLTAGLKSTFPVYEARFRWIEYVLVIGMVAIWIGREWLPLGPNQSLLLNVMFVALQTGVLILLFWLLIRNYATVLQWCLRYRGIFLSVCMILILWGAMVWFGFSSVFGFVATGLDKLGVNVRQSDSWVSVDGKFPGLGEEFMPSLDEGSFLLMPTTMPHAGVEENKRILALLDMAVTAVPEVESVVGKAGRVNSALDPAPMSMFENVINYKAEYKRDENGKRVRFRIDTDGRFVRDDDGDLIPDERGRYFRQWRDHIQTPDDIWNEIVNASTFPGLTSAPRLQPIETRLIMLQTGMRAPMGIKVSGPSLQAIEDIGRQLETALKEVPTVKAEAVFADRVIGKPYLQISLDRDQMARHGLQVQMVQQYIMSAVGGMNLTTTVEGRERYGVRVRYPRELRDDPDALAKILLPTPSGYQIPLGEVATMKFERGPQVIKSENTFLTSYVLFDKKTGFAEVDVVEDAQRHLMQKIDDGDILVPEGVSYVFTGSYENQVRAEKRLSLIVPIALAVIFLILYLQLKSVPVALMVFSGVALAFSGGFILIWLYAQNGFLNFEFLGTNLRDLYQLKGINLSVAVWVGFIALFGIATDGGVVIASYLNQIFGTKKPKSIQAIRDSAVEAGKLRIRPTLMTTATTLLALLPVLSSTGRGADIMIPMAIPSFGGMLIQVLTLFLVPVLYSSYQEFKLKKA